MARVLGFRDQVVQRLRRLASAAAFRHGKPGFERKQGPVLESSACFMVAVLSD
jgi:hypothetical protein